MSEPFIAEIRIFAGNFAPRGWAFCNGTELPIAQNTALYSIVGTTYGGDGRTTLGLPDLRGRAPMHPGAGPGLTTRRLGEQGGTHQITLTSGQLPAHAHALQGTDQAAATPDAAMKVVARTEEDTYGDRGQTKAMHGATLSPTGGNQPHENRQPFLALNFIIALVGLYPSRS